MNVSLFPWKNKAGVKYFFTKSIGLNSSILKLALFITVFLINFNPMLVMN